MIDHDPMPEPPNLQKLVELRGGYGKITASDWRLYDVELGVTLAWLRARHRQVKSAKG